MVSELERAITDAFNSRNVTPLRVFLQKSTNEAVKCSSEFLNKLDNYVIWSLDEKDSNATCVALAVLRICGKNLTFPTGSRGITGIMHQGLIQKMVQWFDKCKQLWIQHGPHCDKSLSKLSEDFFDAIMMVHVASKDAMVGIRSFLHPIGQLVNDVRVCIAIRKEAISALNVILKEISMSLEKEMILSSVETSDMMMNLADQIMQCGDYDMQVSLIEVLFRLTTPDQREKLAPLWFSMPQVACAFGEIQPSVFDMDCRTFLIFVNGLQGDHTSCRVKSYPCLEVYLDNYKLLMPSDKFGKFWIDFNLGSQSISFYSSSVDEKSLAGFWDSISISENEIHSYTVTEHGTKQVLQLELSKVVMTGSAKGSRIIIFFSSNLDILQAVYCICGHRKQKQSTVRKTSTVNMKLKIVTEEDKSQVRANFSNRNSKHGIHKSDTSAENKGNQCLEMFHTSGRKKGANLIEQKTTDTLKCMVTKQNIPVISESKRIPAGQCTDHSQDLLIEDSFVPDTPLMKRKMSQRNNLSVLEIFRRPTQKNNPIRNNEQCSNVAKKQESLLSAQRVPGPYCRKQLHRKRSLHPQKVKERSTDFAPKEVATTMTLISDQKSSEEKIHQASCDLSLHTPEKVQVQGKQLDQKMNRGRQPSMATSIKASTANQERHSNNKRNNTTAGNMVKLISSYYTTDKQSKETVISVPQRWIPPQVSSLCSTGKKNTQAVDVTKSHSKTTSIKKRGICDSLLNHTTAWTGQLAAKEKQNKKKHLFSGTNNKSSPDVIWRTESNKKAQCKTTYTCKQQIRPKKSLAHNSIEAQVLPKCGKSNARLSKEIPNPDKSFSFNKRPRRNATFVKSYKEQDTDESLSVSEMPQATKACKITQPNKSNTTKIQAQRRTSKCRPDHHASSSSTKKMRFPEMSTQSPEFSSLIGLPMCSSPKETSVIQQSSLSLPFAPLTALKLSPITSPPHSPFLGAPKNPDLNCSFSQDSAVSQISLSLSFAIEVQQSPSQAVSEKTEKTPLSKESSAVTIGSTADETIEDEMTPGLTTPFLMMTNHYSRNGENGTMDLKDLDLPDVVVNHNFLSPQFTAKLKMKLQMQKSPQIMDSYHKENMMTIQQHISSLNTQLSKHRTQKLEDIKYVFQEEISKLEQGKSMLNNMEKDLTICREKQHTFLLSYHKQETKSIEALKRTQTGISSILEYEEPLFASQMAHLKKDMKSIQERLLKTMHVEALGSLKRVLHAWVLAD
ncbi:synaptonemal complex protein 2-like isoform X2 [Syngnathoides biaculeatus]|uniref:synaptonemal complex protein 2-like isoform X2 n=1 Tax=Syngnathoides biaculeatus TaxID=300417 RepID=UPI002ADDEE66|nr:synaptonemal complex protein 2-like isoform X2 [Syngnathoides biaculeatus]